MDSDESLLQHTCHPTAEDLFKASDPNEPNDSDGSQPNQDPKYIIPRDIDTTELQKWKEHTLMMLGKQVKIKYDKSKFIYWDVEDVVEHCNVHCTKKNVSEPCFVAENMNPSKINPSKINPVNFFCSFSNRRNENLCQNF